MSERLRCNLFIDVFAVVGAHHRDFARLGAGCCRSFTLFVVVSRSRDNFIGSTIFAVPAFFMAQTRFGARRFKRNNVIAERVVILSTYNNSIITASVCIFVDMRAAISINRTATADILNR